MVLLKIITIFMAVTLQTAVLGQDIAKSDIPYQMEVTESQYGEPVACFQQRDDQGRRLNTLHRDGVNLDELAHWYEKSGSSKMNPPKWLSAIFGLAAAPFGIVSGGLAGVSLDDSWYSWVTYYKTKKEGRLESLRFAGLFALMIAPAVGLESSRWRTNRLFAEINSENDGLTLTRYGALELQEGLYRAEEYGLFTSGLENYCVSESQDTLE